LVRVRVLALLVHLLRLGVQRLRRVRVRVSRLGLAG
jgi:hypothetical protein